MEVNSKITSIQTVYEIWFGKLVTEFGVSQHVGRIIWWSIYFFLDNLIMCAGVK